MENEDIQSRLTWLWSYGYAKNIKPNAEKICIIYISHHRDMFGTHLNKIYGQIKFMAKYNLIDGLMVVYFIKLLIKNIYQIK